MLEVDLTDNRDRGQNAFGVEKLTSPISRKPSATES